jgi:hypothetical protein
MWKRLILTLGFAAVLLLATNATARGIGFFGSGFGLPVHPGIVALPLLGTLPSFVTAPPATFVPQTAIVPCPRELFHRRSL